MRYLSPQADLTFKRVFGEHPDLVMSLLNALLPLTPDQEITDVEYLPAELVPENPLRKFSVVDVRCKDKQGRQFLVEMQMLWSPEFKQRVLFNASKAYVRQLDKGVDYSLLQPVYSLNLLNQIYESDLEGYYHYYRMVHVEHTDRVIDGLQLVFVELPKFTPQTYGQKKMHVLWLRFLTEINGDSHIVPQELLDVPEIRKAVEVLEESAFTPAQLQGYDDFWDDVRVRNTLLNRGKREGREEGFAEGLEEGIVKGREEGIAKGREEGIEKGLEKGREEGREEGIAEGIEKGLAEGEKRNQLNMAAKMKSKGFSIDQIAEITGLTAEEIEKA